MSKAWVIILLSWLAIMPATACAQFVSQITVPTWVEDTEIIASSVSCYGNICTASILADDTTTREVKILFKRSTDGGRTWETQDPGLRNQLVDNGNRLVKIQQIDSLNAIAIGDTTIVLRTFDGGLTWRQQQLPTSIVDLEDVSFANAREGIIVAAGTEPSIFTTTDSGEHWLPVTFWRPSLWQCHAYGNGRFRVFKSGYGETYYTSDNWKTVDSTKGAIDRSDSGQVLGSCFFGTGDMLIESGNYFIGSRAYPIIYRSSDDGQSWKKVFEDTDIVLGTVGCMSPLDRDTLVAGLGLGRSRILFSTNRGITWSLDTLLFDSDENFIVGSYSVALNSSNQFVAVMGYYLSAIVLGDLTTDGVQTYAHIPYYSYLYPNPASQYVNVVSQDRRHPIRVYDALGREVLRSELDDNGKCKLDVSSLADGIYVVMLDHDGRFLPVSSVAVIGR